jgi:hypothetical protein
MRVLYIALLGISLAGCSGFGAAGNNSWRQTIEGDRATQNMAWKEVILPKLEQRQGDPERHEPIIRPVTHLWKEEPGRMQNLQEEGSRLLADYLSHCPLTEAVRYYVQVEKVIHEREDLVILGNIHGWLLQQTPACMRPDFPEK